MKLPNLLKITKLQKKKIQLTISQDELAKIIQSGVLTDSDFNIKLV